jgi:glycosyltransferase involved in cell wall biosynthesis
LLNAQPFDLVVSSGPPHSAHIAAAVATWGRREPFWVDMRDPWFTHFAPQPAAVNAPRMTGVPNPHLGLERTIVARANRVITNTSKFYEIFHAWYPNVPASFIPNGIDRDRLPLPAPKYSGFSIAYAGTVYLSRNLSPILRALPAVLDRIPAARDCLRLRIAGSMDAEHEARFAEEVTRLGLTSLVEARGRVSNAEAMDLVNRSHLALVLAQDQPAQIPAKIYECVAMGVPTLVIAESSSAAANEARRIGAMTCEPDDIAGIEQLVEKLWSAPPAAASVSNAPIGYEVIAAQMDALLRTDLGEAAAPQVRSEVGPSEARVPTP